MWTWPGTGEKGGGYPSSHAAGAIGDQSDPPWGQPSTFCHRRSCWQDSHGPPAHSAVFASPHSCSRCRHQPPGSLAAPSPFPLPLQPGNSASSGLCGCTRTRHQPGLPAPASPPLPCAHPGRAPSALRLRSAGLTPAHVPLLVDPIRPCFCHWPAPPSSLAASPSRAVPACSGPTHAVHMPGQGTAWPQPGPPQPGSPVSQVAPALVACPVSHCYVHVCTWPLRLHGHLQLGVHSASATVPACLGPWLLNPEALLRTPTALAATVGPQSDYKGPHSCQCRGPQQPVNPSDIAPPGPAATPCPHTWCPERPGIQCLEGS